jgi:hypothetical protein
MAKLALALVALVAGFSAHSVANDSPAPTPTTVPVRRVFDPRPYLAAPTTTTTVLVVAASEGSGSIRCPEWIPLAESVGVRPDEMKTAMRILYRESRCNPRSVNSTKNADGSVDYGLSQVNDRTWCLPSSTAPRGWLQQAGIVETCRDLFNAETNLRAMVAIMRYAERVTGCPWHPWRLCDGQ